MLARPIVVGRARAVSGTFMLGDHTSPIGLTLGMIGPGRSNSPMDRNTLHASGVLFVTPYTPRAVARTVASMIHSVEVTPPVPDCTTAVAQPIRPVTTAAIVFRYWLIGPPPT
jgi:hypothetical protein